MTRGSRTCCPTVTELETSLLGGSPSPAITAHLEACSSCAELAAEIASNHAFLVELQSRLGAGVTVPLKAPPVQSDLVPGYVLTRRIGRGGQGEVYEGVQLATRRRVAVKIVHAGEHEARSRRFEREVELASSLRHAGIVSVLHCERLRDTSCALIMEYIDGVPIDEWAALLTAGLADRSHRQCVRAKLRALALVADALQHAHARGVVHRDLKPENILVQSDGDVRIVDFGVAKRAHDLARATLTGGFSGTLAYAAPEQLSSVDERVDIRTDIYSLGVVMYEVFAGRRPFDSHRPLDVVIRDVIETPPPPLGRLLPEGVPGAADIEAVVAKALAKRPEARYQSAAAMQADIASLLEGQPVSARLPGTFETLRALSARHRLAFGMASVSLALLCLVAVGMTWASVRLSSQRVRLAEALYVSNIERGRAESNAANLVRAERQLWPELIAAGADPISGPWCELFDGETGQSIGRLEGHAGRVIDAVFSRDGRLLYTVGADGELIAWDLANRRPAFRSDPCGAIMRAIALSPDGRTIATGSDDRIIRLWDSTTGALRQTIHGPRQHIFELAFHPGGSVLFSCGRDPGVQVWDVRSGRELAVLDGHRDMVMSLALSPDGGELVTTGADRQVLEWNFAMLAHAIAANSSHEASTAGTGRSPSAAPSRPSSAASEASP